MLSRGTSFRKIFFAERILSWEGKRQQDTCYRGSEERIVTTHSRAIRDSQRFSHSTIVLDEDPLGTILTIRDAKFTDLLILAEHDSQLKAAYEYIHALEPLKLHEYDWKLTKEDRDLREIILDCYESLTPDSQIYHLFSAKWLIKQSNGWVRFVIFNDLPADRKTVILSATPNLEIYRRLYGDDLEVLSVENVEANGKVIQDNSISYSRRSLQRE